MLKVFPNLDQIKVFPNLVHKQKTHTYFDDVITKKHKTEVGVNTEVDDDEFKFLPGSGGVISYVPR